MGNSEQPVLIKKYTDRRLYRPAAGAYTTLDDLAAMVEDDEDFVVIEAATGEDVTPFILKQIIRQRAIHG
jgi:polyhydroxyalkanoate synthesis repressor PhaR